METLLAHTQEIEITIRHSCFSPSFASLLLLFFLYALAAPLPRIFQYQFRTISTLLLLFTRAPSPVLHCTEAYTRRSLTSLFQGKSNRILTRMNHPFILFFGCSFSLLAGTRGVSFELNSLKFHLTFIIKLYCRTTRHATRTLLHFLPPFAFSRSSFTLGILIHNSLAHNFQCFTGRHFFYTAASSVECLQKEHDPGLEGMQHLNCPEDV